MMGRPRLPRPAWFQSSLGFQVVGYLGIFADREVSALAEVSDEAQGLGFSDFISKVRDQETDECLLGPRAGGRGLLPMLQYLGLPFVQDSGLSFGLWLGLRLWERSGRGWGRQPGRGGECKRGEAIMTAGRDMPAPEMLDERVITGVLGNDVKVAGGVAGHGAAHVIGERKIKRVFAGGGKAHQLRRDSMLEKFFDQGNIELSLPRAYQQGEGDSLASDDREINLMHVLEINEDVVYPRWEIIGNGWHKDFRRRRAAISVASGGFCAGARPHHRPLPQGEGVRGPQDSRSRRCA